MRRFEPPIAPGIGKLFTQSSYIVPYFAFEFQKTARWLGIALRSGCIQNHPLAEHRFLDLFRNHGADLPEVLADGVHLESGMHQEFEVAFQLAWLLHPLSIFFETLTDEMVDQNFFCALTVAIHASV